MIKMMNNNTKLVPFVSLASGGSGLLLLRSSCGRQRITAAAASIGSRTLARIYHGINSSNSIVRPLSSQVVTENQIAAWLQKGGDKDLKKKNNKGKNPPQDNKEKSKDGQQQQPHHQYYLANALGVGNDFVHAKILADNNFKPRSIQLRLELDQKWDELQNVIRNDYYDNAAKEEEESSVQEYAKSARAKALFAQAMAALDEKAKQLNHAII